MMTRTLLLVSFFTTSTFSFIPAHQKLTFHREVPRKSKMLSQPPLKRKLHSGIGGFETTLYDLQLWMDDAMKGQLETISPLTAFITYGAGLLAALSPCGMSLLPFTVAYLSAEAGAASIDDDDNDNNGDLSIERSIESSELADGQEVVAIGKNNGTRTVIALSISFALGAATTLAILGLAATLLGQVWGSISIGSAELSRRILSLATALFAVVCGLNLLDIVDVDFSGFLPASTTSLQQQQQQQQQNHSEDQSTKTSGMWRGPLRAFAFGASSALVSSPCSTPVLASLLAFVASATSASALSSQSILGLGLLLFYAAGYTTPVVAAGALGATATTQAAKMGGNISELSSLVLAASLIAFGVYSGLDAAFPPISIEP